MIQEPTLKRAISEAQRFLRAAKEIEKDDLGHFSNGVRTAAVKRASMDLTRALADLRGGR